jgi:hypothetical protein
MKNHFLIIDHNRDGEHEYYDSVLVSTSMSEAEMDDNQNSWEESFLYWQFGGIQEEEDENGDIWSDHRIVSIYEFKPVPEENVPVLDQYFGTFDLDEIIRDVMKEREEDREKT